MEKREPSYTVGAGTMENSVEVLEKLKAGLLSDLAVPFLDIYLEKMKTLIYKDICTPVFIAALVTIATKDM